MKWFSFLIIFVLMIHRIIYCVNTRFQEQYSWNVLDFQFPDETTRQSLIDSQEYIPIANVPVGMAIWQDKFFITIPRMIPGILSTLNYFQISDFSAESSPQLIPYPNFDMTRIRPSQTDFNDSIISVFRVKVDACDRLWFVDVGFESISTDAAKQLAKARLFIIDLRTDQIIRQYQFETSVVSSDSVMGGNIEVDVTADTCDEAFAYIPDFNANRLVVYSYELETAWRIKHPYFYFDPFGTVFQVDDLILVWYTGIFSVTLSSIQTDGFRILYFNSISSNYQFAVSTRYLKNRDRTTDTSTLLHAYRLLGTKGRNMQGTVHVMHQPTGTLFYTIINQHGVGCWNSNRFSNNFTPDTNYILATDNITMTFNNDIMYDDYDNIWLLSDLFPVSNHRGLKEDQVNFRIFVASVSDLIQGTICEDIKGSSNNGGVFNFLNDDSNDYNSNSINRVGVSNFRNPGGLIDGSTFNLNSKGVLVGGNYDCYLPRDNWPKLIAHQKHNSGL